MIDDLHGDELAAKGQDVEIHLDAPVHLQDLGQRHAFAPPSLNLENRRVICPGSGGCNLNEPAITRYEDEWVTRLSVGDGYDIEGMCQDSRHFSSFTKDLRSRGKRSNGRSLSVSLFICLILCFIFRILYIFYISWYIFATTLNMKYSYLANPRDFLYLGSWTLLWPDAHSVARACRRPLRKGSARW